MVKTRDLSIDMAKGVLIVMLIAHHIVDICGTRMTDAGGGTLHVLEVLQYPFILCFFMPAFFVITGMCSNFESDFKTFLIKQFRTLIVPAFVFGLIYFVAERGSCRRIDIFFKNFLISAAPFWFLKVMFFGKIIYYFLNKRIRSGLVILLILLGLSFLGTVLNATHLFKNVYCHRQLFDLTLYIAIGAIFKSKIIDRRIGLYSVVLYVLLVIVCFIFWGVKLPYVTYGFGTTPSGWPFHVLLSISGTVVLLGLCRWLKPRTWLVGLGQCTLIIYMINWDTLSFFIDAFERYISQASVMSFLLAYVVILISTLSIGVCINYVFQHTRLRVVMGKSWR